MIKPSVIICSLVLFASASVLADSQESYSPAVARSYPDQLLFGDTHVHTWLSGDAYALGTRLTPAEAYRFARGEVVRATGGEEVRLRRPLDFLLIADHAENLGVLPKLGAGDPRLLKTPDGARFFEMLKAAPALHDVIKATTREIYDAGSLAMGLAKEAWNGDYKLENAFEHDVWQGIIDTAEKYNEPGRFTTFVGYEYSSNPPMLHRNVLFAGGPEKTAQTLPFSKYDSYNPEDLWAHLIEYKERTGSDVIAIPHNSNLSNGNMFRPLTFNGEPLTERYASIRAELEPIVEVTQIKGDSEAHPFISPDDQFAGYETWGRYSSDKSADDRKGQKQPGNKKQQKQVKPPVKIANKEPKQTSVGAPDKDGFISARAEPGQNTSTPENTSQEDLARQSYVRPALKRGLDLSASLGVNPFKLGMIGSTDSHTGLATAEEDNFWGKMGANEPGPYRASGLGIFASSGYAAVWAHENTRSSIFAALKRREVYATTGPHIRLRFFGGWDYSAPDVERPDVADIGYRLGVPMGGDLVASPESDRAPTFMLIATRDPDGANLDRLQVIKGWHTASGGLEEKVFDVAWSDDRKMGRDGKLPDIVSTVDTETATYTNSVGAALLSVHWVDPDFDPREAAFYYVRVIQIPTPRWTGYDAAFYGLKDIPEHRLVTQERAYSSPIWYTPR